MISNTFSFSSSSTVSTSLSSFLSFSFLFVRTAHAAVDFFNTVLRSFVKLCVSYYQATMIFFNFNAADLSRNIFITIKIFRASDFISSRAQYNSNSLSRLIFYTLSQSSSSYSRFIDILLFYRCALVCFS